MVFYILEADFKNLNLNDSNAENDEPKPVSFAFY